MIMMNSLYVFIFFGTIMCLEKVSAERDHKAFHEAAQPFADECAKELGIDVKNEIEKAKRGEIKMCFVACFFKKFGIIKNGMIDEIESVNKVSTFITEPEELEKYVAQVKECTVSANEHDVTDGDKACERSHYFIKCLFERLGGDDPFSLLK